MNISLLAGFLIKTILWLLACLAVWYPLGSILAMPVGWLSSALAQLLFPGWAEGVHQTGTTLALLTSLQVPPPPGVTVTGTALLTLETEFLSYGYGLPLLAALLLASWPRGMAWKMAVGTVALMPFQAVSVLFAWLKQVAIQAGPAVAAQADFSETSRNLIGLGYQFGSLVLPTLVPVVLWLILDRKLVSTLVLEAYLEKAKLEEGGN